MAAIEIQDLTKTFETGSMVLAGIDLTVRDGELLVLLGPSGCGKSTLLRMIAGLEFCDTGDIVIGNVSVRDKPPQERNVAMVFQNYALYPHMTVMENLAFPLRMHHVPQADVQNKVMQIAAMLELETLLLKKPGQLSGGQKQRVAMGRAMVREPAVFLLDEPLSNLDARLRHQLRRDIADLQRRIATTMIYVTHDQQEAMALGDRIVVLHNGVIQQVGTPHEIYHRPTNIFVAAFVGTPQINLFESILSPTSGTFRITIGNHSISLDPEFHTCDVLKRYGSAPVTVGIRPESFRVKQYGTQSGPGLHGVIVQTEDQGHEALVFFMLDGCDAQFSMRCRRQDLPPAVRDLTLEVTSAEILIFDADGELLVTHTT